MSYGCYGVSYKALIQGISSKIVVCLMTLVDDDRRRGRKKRIGTVLERGYILPAS